jgi:serine/threonine protein kinase
LEHRETVFAMATCPNCRAQYADDVKSCPNDGEGLLPDEAFANADAELRAGDVVGEYQVEKKLGEGGFGAVYRAVHPLIGKTAAIKVLNRQYSSNPQMVSRFIAEARAVNQIRHRNIIDIFSFGALPDGRQYYVMELLEGMPFDAYVDQHVRIAPETAMPILRAVARALDAAHQHGIVHRDLKPENIYLVFDEDGVPQPKLLDFGIAKLLTEGSGGHKTRTGTPMGTPFYMSPEQCRGQKIDSRTDVYSFGCVCFQVLTGKLPFDGDAVMDILVKHMTAPAPRLSEIAPDLRPELDAPLLRMLDKDPEKRPQSVGAAMDELLRAGKAAGYNVPTPVGAAPSSSVPSGGAASVVRAGGTTGPKPTPGEAELAQAKTMADNSTPPPDFARGKTFMGQETDVAPKPRRTAMLVVAILAGVLVVGGAGFFVSQRMSSSAAASAPAPPASTTVAASATSAPAASGATAGAASSAPALAPTAVAVTIDAMPAGVPITVYEGTQKLGTAPGPLQLAYGSDKVSLTFKADGYTPQSIDVVPTENRTVSVTLQKVRQAAPVTTKKDYEDPFGH